MSRRFLSILGLLGTTAILAATAYSFQPPAVVINPALPAFEFRQQRADNPEAAALALFRGVATGSPGHFVQHLLIGVCDGPNSTLQKFAESLHATEFHHGDDTFTFYDLRDQNKGIYSKKPMRVIGSAAFDPQDKQVVALQLEAVSTYGGETFMAIDVEGQDYDGRALRTRVVVAKVNGHWYALPRCRSARSFYKIADAMQIEPRAESKAP